jgi:hypothetical protein
MKTAQEVRDLLTFLSMHCVGPNRAIAEMVSWSAYLSVSMTLSMHDPAYFTTNHGLCLHS